jgi:hypothetical protein
MLLILLWLLSTAAAQTCVTGAPGTNGADLEIVITTDSLGCYYETIDGVLVSKLCNGTNGLAGQSTSITLLTGINLGCAQFGSTAGNNVCNGTVGTQGAQGATGPAGAQGNNYLPLITTAGQAPGCVAIVANGSTPLCNATTGQQGQQGIQGIQGIQGNLVLLVLLLLTVHNVQD